MDKSIKMKELQIAKILAIDDDEWFLRLVIKKFQDIDPGFQITPASTAEEAINYLQREEFDCILCDHKLPGTVKIAGKIFPSDGINLMRKFLEMNIDTPVIFITGQGSEEIASQALLSGASGYFIKRVQPGYFSLMTTSIRQTIERYWLKKELLQSEARYRDLFENSAGLIFIFDENGQLLESNKNFRNLFNYTINEIKGLSYKSLAPSEDLDKWEILLNRIYNGNEESQLLRSLTKGGSLIHLDITARPIYGQDEDKSIVIGIQAIAKDITHQIETQQALIDSEEKHRAIIEGSAEGTVIIDDKGLILDWNRAASDITGLSADESINNTINQVLEKLKPDDLESFPFINHSFEKLTNLSDLKNIVSRTNIDFIEIIIKNVIDNKKRYLEILRFIIEHSKGDRIILNIRDITERKLAEIESKALNERYRSLIEQGGIGVWVSDLSEVTTYVNESLAKMLGYSANEMIGTLVTDYITPQDSGKISTITKKRLRGEKINNTYELEFFHRSGNKISTLVSGAAIHDEGGNVIETYGFIRDITQQKQTTRELETTKKFLESIIDSMTDGLYTYDLNYRITAANPRIAEILGYKSPQKLIGRNIFDLFPQSEQLRVKQLIDERMTGVRSEKDLRLIYLSAQGTEVETRVSSVPLFVDEKVIGAVVTVTDVSEIIRIDDILKTIQEELQAILENIPLGLLKINKLGQVTYFNKKAQQLLDFTKILDLTTINILTFQTFKEAGLISVFQDIIYQKIEKLDEINTVLTDEKGNTFNFKLFPFPIHHDFDGTITSWVILFEKTEES